MIATVVARYAAGCSRVLRLVGLVLAVWAGIPVSAGQWIVDEGQARAQIVLAKEPIPVAAKGHGDPLHNVVGSKPNWRQPWYVNVVRARVRGDDKEYTAFSPTGKIQAHDLSKFGKIFTGIRRDEHGLPLAK